MKVPEVNNLHSGLGSGRTHMLIEGPYFNTMCEIDSSFIITIHHSFNHSFIYQTQPPLLTSQVGVSAQLYDCQWQINHICMAVFRLVVAVVTVPEFMVCASFHYDMLLIPVFSCLSFLLCTRIHYLKSIVKVDCCDIWNS